jgi:hypothetical protein
MAIFKIYFLQSKTIRKQPALPFYRPVTIKSLQLRFLETYDKKSVFAFDMVFVGATLYCFLYALLKEAISANPNLIAVSVTFTLPVNNSRCAFSSLLHK